MRDPGETEKDLVFVNQRNTDTLDFAAELQEELNKKGLAQARKALVPEQHPDFDGKHCIECAEDMPEQRVTAGRIRCVGCQSIKEQRSRLFR